MNFSKKIRAISFILFFALIIGLFPPFSLQLNAATYTFNEGAVVISEVTGFSDGDTIFIKQGVYSVTVDSVDVYIIFGEDNNGVRTGVTIDRTNENVVNGVIGSAETGSESLADLYKAGESLYNNAQNLGKDENVWERAGGYYVPTAPFLIMGDANVEASFYGDCVFKAGKNGVYLESSDATRISTVNTGNTNSRGGYAGIQVEGGASLTISNADNLSAYGAYQNAGDPAKGSSSITGSSDQVASGGAGIGGGASPCPKSAGTENYTYGTPGNITILNGNIFAKGGHLGAGIGGGLNSAATTGAIKLLGGNITAQGGKWAAGIGEGDSVSGNTANIFSEGTGYEIIIGGDTSKNLNVTALGGYQSAGIGTTDEISRTNGNALTNKNSLMSISIYSGNIRALSGMGSTASAAIGAGNSTNMLDNSISIYSDAYISAASFSAYAITNYGSTNNANEIPLPVVNLDPNAYMYLARFPEGTKSEEREFPLFPVKHIKIGDTLCPILVNATSNDILSEGWNASAHTYYSYDAATNKFYSVTANADANGVLSFSDPVLLDGIPNEDLSYYFEDPIKRTSDGKQIFMNTPSATILEDEFKTNDTISFYAKDGNTYYRVNRNGEYIDADGNVVDASSRVSVTVGTTLYRYYDINKIINIYTVPGQYKAIALTLPDPSQYGGAYVLEAPKAGEDDEDVYSAIKKYNAGVTSGEIVFENESHFVRETTTDGNTVMTEYINLKEDNVADDIIDLNVGLKCDVNSYLVVNDLLNYKENVRSYTIYVPSDTTKFYMDFLYSNTNSKGATVNSVALTANSGVGLTGQGTNIGTGGVLTGGTVSANTTMHAFEIEFKNGETRADLWIRKTDNLAEGASGSLPYIVYKVTVIVKPKYYLNLKDLSKVYDGEPVVPGVVSMTDKASEITDSLSTVIEDVSDATYDDTQTATIINNQTESLIYSYDWMTEETQDIMISSSVSNVADSGTLTVTTTLKPTEGGAERTVTMDIDLRNSSVSLTSTTDSQTVGRFNLIRSTSGNSATIQLTSTYKNWWGQQQKITHTILTINVGDPAISSAPVVDTDTIMAEGRAKAEVFLETYPNVVFVKEFPFEKTQNITQSVAFTSGVATVQNTPLSLTGSVETTGKYVYKAKIEGVQNIELTEKQTDSIQYTYYIDKNDNGLAEDDERLTSVPEDAVMYMDSTYYTGNYLVEADLIGDVFEAYGIAKFVITKRPLKIEAIENWLTYLEEDDIEALKQSNSDTWPLDITNNPWLIAAAGEKTYETGNVVEGDQIELNPAIIYYYTPATITYSANKITLRLRNGTAEEWLIYDGLDNSKYANRNYMLVNMNVLDETDSITQVPGSLAYRVDRAIFKKTAAVTAYWRKFWPTWRGTPLEWTDYDPVTGISTTAKEGEADIDYRSPSNVSHRDYLWLRTVNYEDNENRYSVDIEFGEMNFVHSKSIWDVNRYEYVEVSGESKWSGNDGVNNRITITNRSNVYINYSIELKLHDFYGQGIIADISARGNTYEATNLSDDLAWNWSQVDAQQEAEPYSVSKYLYLSGVPFAESPADGSGAGTIIITIKPSAMVKTDTLGTS